MALKYVCDSCGEIITSPHQVKMKEFYIGYHYDFDTVFPDFTTKTVKVHLCDDCFKNLKTLFDKKKGEK